MSFSSRVSHLEPEGAYAVLARAQALEAQGRTILHLEIGQPDFPTWPNISLAGIRAIAGGQTRYNPPAGLPRLREAIAADAGLRHGIEIRPEQVVVGPGAKPGLFFPTLALVQPGDEVIYPDPGFPTYAAMIGVAGGTPVPVPLREENQFSFDLAAFDRSLSDHTKLIILNSPANPTGGVIRYIDGNGRPLLGGDIPVAYTPQLRDWIIALLQEIRRAETTRAELHRSHQSAPRCEWCDRRDTCGESQG